MRDVRELIANIKGGGSSAHAFILESRSRAARDSFVSGLIEGLDVHGLDVVHMQMSGKNGYKAEDANAFSERLEMGAYGDHLIGIIDDADSLSEVAQNKLLKTIEEPRGPVIILLGSSNSDHLLSTVRSRCSVVRLGDGMDASDEDAASAEAIKAAASLMTDKEAAFCDFRDAIDKSVKTRSDALVLIDALEDDMRERMMNGQDPAVWADRMELAEKARMDIEREMDRNRALKRLYLELTRP